MAAEFERLTGRTRPGWFVVADPPGRRLGSGGGAAHLLVEAWRSGGRGEGFAEWLGAGSRLLIHGGGESRRLPAYAPMGKPLLPVPALRWSRGQTLSQTLLDLQLPAYESILAHAPRSYVLMVASGDVLLRFGRELPELPAVDVLGLGMWVTPERAKDFGVFFTPRERPSELAFFLQKPAPARIRELALEHVYLVDTGMWLLSARAVDLLVRRCGWDGRVTAFAGGRAGSYELYGEFGAALGTRPVAEDPEVRALSCAVVPLPEPEFYHFGTSRQMIESVSALQNRELDELKLGMMGARRHPDQYLQNSRFEYPLRREENHTLWVENAHVGRGWQLAHDHVITGVPPNEWDLRLEPGVCLDFVPVAGGWCVRCYGIDDTFRGRLNEPGTHWLGRPVGSWLARRGLAWSEAKLEADVDIQRARLFPVLGAEAVDSRFLEWLYAVEPPRREDFARRWTEAARSSAEDLQRAVDLGRLETQRRRNRLGCFEPLLRNARWSVFYKLDLASSAALFAESGLAPEAAGNDTEHPLEPMQEVHRAMFVGEVCRRRGDARSAEYEARAFARLREMVIREAQLAPADPRCAVLEDQIVWGRSPVRLDLAGGWTDTPPYCLEQGGRVVNLAVDLNGQPPLQVYAKLCPDPVIVMRSIDLGAEQRITTYEELETYGLPGSEFAVAKAAFALAGFLPRFHVQPAPSTLKALLEAFGGGIELSVLAAVPKGSGLGTSSILAATILATLADLCGLGWDRTVLFARTLALEQMLTTGGGWQDQAGGIYRGVKLVETSPGLSQRATLRWLPDHLFDGTRANRSAVLYYTGITRLAKQILHEIVRGIFLNSPRHLATLKEIGANAEVAFNALQRSDEEGLHTAVRASWLLNQELDSGTNPPAVQAILDTVSDEVEAAKLLGAGGGGYLLLLAKDETACRRIREKLRARPPNARARFVDFSLSHTGLQVTRS